MSVDTDKIPYVPERLEGLTRLALNLWWRWDRTTRLLFRTMDPVLWRVTRHNPVEMLRRVSPARLAKLAHDPEFTALYDRSVAGFERALEPDASWFTERFPELGERPVAYFCAEFGFHNSIPIYSGGLGVLAGDHCKAASDLGVPMVGVGLLYSKGYLDQRLNAEGWQESSHEPFDPEIMPLVRLTGDDGSPAIAEVTCDGRPVHLGAWRLDAGRVRLYLLESDLESNDPADRELTHELYGGGQERRLKQEWLLGVGGVRVLRALGVEPGAWHANEGHATFMMVERLREHLVGGASWEEAIRDVRARTVFTTHTPVPAGHDVFSDHLFRSVTRGYPEALGVEYERLATLGHHPALDGDGARFHMTAAAIRLAGHVNGVSKRHGQVTRELWRPLWPEREASEVPVGYVTNGVHLPSWMAHRYMQLLDQHFGEFWEKRHTDTSFWDSVLDLDDSRVWEIHLALKESLLTFCREQARRRWKELWKEAAQLAGAGTLLSSDPLTIGFARRFATYKRADLLFRDEERLQGLLTDERRPVQIIFAGKAHPADEAGKRVLQRVWKATRDVRFEGRVAFVEDYDLHVAHRLVQGVDLWLNLPRVPKEASGTSGMKAALNCVPQLSTLDGWWAEGFNGENGWAIPPSNGNDEEADARDHEALFELLEREVVPAYYERDERGIPHGWVRRMKESLRVAGKRFTTARMVAEYAEEHYAPALRGVQDGDDPPTADERIPSEAGTAAGGEAG